MNLKQALTIFWSRRHLIAAVFVTFILGSLVVTWQLKREYIAATQIYVNLTEQGASPTSAVPPAVVRNYIATQIEAMRSRGTALTVVDQEGLANEPALIAAFKETNGTGDIREWIAAILLARVDISRLRTSDIIQISYRSESAESAARIANGFATAFLRLDVELRAVPAQGLVRWYEERLNQLRERFADVERQRSQLRIEAVGRGDFDASGVPDGASSLPTTLANARNAVIQARSALETARSGQNPPSENAELLMLRRQLSDVDLTLRRELPKLGGSHQRIINLQAIMDQLQSQIRTAVDRLRAELVADRQRELVAAERRVPEVEAIISREESRRHETVGSRAASLTLERELESLRVQIEGLVQRRERASVEGSVMAGNMSVLSRAAVPMSPSWPRSGLNLTVAILLGLAFGFAIAFLREMLDRRLRCVDDLFVYFDVPVLGEVASGQLSTQMAPLPAAPERKWAVPRRPAPQPLLENSMVAGA